MVGRLVTRLTGTLPVVGTNSNDYHGSAWPATIRLSIGVSAVVLKAGKGPR